MKARLGSLIAGCLMVASQASAETPKYFYSLGVGDGAITSNNTESSAKEMNASFGLEYMKYFGVELRAGFSSDDTGSLITDSQLSYQALMLRLGYRWDRVGVYLLGGQAAIQASSELGFEDSGTATGISVNLFGSPTTALNLSHLNIDDGNFTTTNIGFQYFFGGYR